MKINELVLNPDLCSSSQEMTQYEKLLKYYEEAGPDYEMWSTEFNMHFGYYQSGVNPFNLEAMLSNMNKVVFEKLDLLHKVNPVLADMGCGLGATLRHAHEYFNEPDAYGITLVPWQVRQAQRLNCEDNRSDITVLQGNYCRTPFFDNSVDGVWAIESSCYAKGASKSDLLNEIYRILKPGGRFVIADGFKKHSHTMGKVITKAYTQLCHSWALEQLGDIGRVETSMRKIGYKDINVENASFKVAPSVAHVPFTVIRFLLRELFFGKKKMTKARWDNLKSPLLTMIVGLAQSHFGYYIISGKK